MQWIVLYRGTDWNNHGPGPCGDARGHAAREGEFMRVLRIVSLVSGLVALWWMAGPDAAFAQEEDDFGRSGFYIGLGGALTHLMDADRRLEDEFEGVFSDELPPDHSVEADAKTSFGLNGRGGYRFHPHFAAELEVDWHSPFDVEFLVGTEEQDRIELEPLVFTANTKGYLFKDRFQPYAVLGIGLMTAELQFKRRDGSLVEDERFTGFAARFGGGADLYITEHIVLNAEIRYVLPTGAVESFDMLSFGWGLQYRF